MEYGMGPRGAALICGYTYHHRRLESALAELKHTEVQPRPYVLLCVLLSHAGGDVIPASVVSGL